MSRCKVQLESLSLCAMTSSQTGTCSAHTSTRSRTCAESTSTHTSTDPNALAHERKHAHSLLQLACVHVFPISLPPLLQLHRPTHINARAHTPFHTETLTHSRTGTRLLAFQLFSSLLSSLLITSPFSWHRCISNHTRIRALLGSLCM